MDGDRSPARVELEGLLALLRDEGLIDARGAVLDPAAVVEQVQRRRGAFRRLADVVDSGGGSALQRAVGGTATALVLAALERLGS